MSPPVRQDRGHIAAESLAGELMSLIAIPSVTGEEEAIARHLHRRVESAGRDALAFGRSILVPPPADRRPLVVLAGHIDTVPPRGNAAPRREGDTILGRGAADMKGGVAVLLSLLDRPETGSGWARVAVILYAGEEGPAEGNELAGLLDGPAAWARAAALAILLEPTGDAIEVGCNGSIHVEVRFLGEACHSARPWLGRNAIGAALDWLAAIDRFAPRAHSIHGYEFMESASVTMLRAGTARNMIPGDLTANLNYRFPPGIDLATARAEALRLCAPAAEARIVDAAPSGSVPLDDPLFAAFLERSGLPSRAKQGWTDVARFGERGIPALNFGPGDPQLAHRDDERVAIDSLVRCRDLLARFLDGPRPFGERMRDATPETGEEKETG
ncbi:MAG: succinyl-diaminopimelate desuccinylase [Candidatus Eisenbacteria bacterium]|nr:succinyl-diaminopimelate desuccinylase [Candidatus Eisenbacteria bacterium]